MQDPGSRRCLGIVWSAGSATHLATGLFFASTIWTNREVQNIRVLLGVLLLALFLLVTFFGLGPVLFADGSMTERMITLGIVIIIYLAIASVAFRIFRKKE
ncbi:DUF6954 family protein [Paenibacillus glycanilyticus]|uniref:DUF6954 family protein n=1 Tax=Paenibacillus glycanilyticus TaxID=126569 RepID=UPI0037C8360D